MRPNAEMSSGQATFDLKAAREACTKLYLPWTYFETDDQIHSQLVETEYGEYGSVICRYQEEICQFLRETRSREIIAGVNKLPAALDEIERLQKENLELNVAIVGPDQIRAHQKCIIDDQAKRIAELEADLEYYKSGFHSERGVHERVAAILGTDDAPWMLAQRAKERIAELVSENENLREWGISNASDAAHEKVRTEKQLAALKKLGEAKRARGKALVEERAKRLVADRGDCPYRSPIKNQLISRCDKGIICDWCQCPIKDEWRDEARDQLRREGKL